MCCFTKFIGLPLKRSLMPITHVKSFMPWIDKQSDHAGHSLGVGWRLSGRCKLGRDFFPR
jgi:hypothetical protein